MSWLRSRVGPSGHQGSTPEPPPVPEEVRRVVVVGCGTMGQQIGFQCAGHGLDVVLYDIAPGALESARGRIDAYRRGLSPPL
jgi:threonine dehydrogenase-like Zn-dependent dehydrogenase